MVNLAFILALPRSGSTVLSALLDKYQGVVSPPESSFPQMLSVATLMERSDPRILAALYLGSTFTPTPLSLDEAAACMTQNDESTLVALGLAVAVKLGRNPEQIKAVVWKTPRTVGLNKAPISTSGRFIVLRRNPHNVFESQFRVQFGEKNRNPYRFAIFRESYEHAFARLPEDRVMQVEYDDLPAIIPDLLDFIGAGNHGLWKDHQSSMQMAVEQCSWMTQVNSDFSNTDSEKRARLSPEVVHRLERALRLARLFRPWMGPLRSYFDRRSAATHRELAEMQLRNA